MLAILEYGAGNQTSVRRSLEHLGISCVITDKPAELEKCDGIIFPGVGAAAAAMAKLESLGLAGAIKNAVAKGQPLLGICLGCQILLEHSEESDTRTLGILPGQCRKFAENLTDYEQQPVKIPHMGWNNVKQLGGAEIFKGIPADAEFYFVHSYFVNPQAELVLGTTWHGHEFCSVYGRPGLWAVQFHAEKSGRFGLQLLKNFNDYCQERIHAF